MKSETIIKQIRHPMDWLQILAIVGSIAAMWYAFFNVLREDMKIMQVNHREDMAKNEAHWREMFTYMSSRIDNIKENSSQTTLGMN